LEAAMSVNRVAIDLTVKWEEKMNADTFYYSCFSPFTPMPAASLSSFVSLKKPISHKNMPRTVIKPTEKGTGRYIFDVDLSERISIILLTNQGK
jgi:hypothetical protein